MSMSVKFQNPIPSLFPADSPEAPATPHQPRIAEAPDRGDAEAQTEAPDARQGRLPEAPDAGFGRMALLEHEFTHGRSQS